jgi:transposase InsO family protein
MTIVMRDGARPVRVCTARQVPAHLEAGAKRALEGALRSGVIVPVDEPTEWISPAFFVPKADPTKARLVTDYTALNRYVERPVHPFPSPADVVRGIDPKATVFAKLDAVDGYFQIPLDRQSSLLTTFILPTGRYRYTRAPMGLSSSSDEFCRRTDVALAGLPGVMKVVDDILVMGWDVDDLSKKLDVVLAACDKHDITLARHKFLVGDSVTFAGFVISKDGVKPDPGKTSAIANFPQPTDVSSVRSFLGLANQIGLFVSDLSSMTEPIRGLLKKHVAFTWGPEQQRAFQEVKRSLTSDLCVAPYDVNKPAVLFTDASSVHGLGYALMQENRLVMAGSRSLIDAETRYSVMEIEATAIAWAIKACRHYLVGNPGFVVRTDHKPLVGIFRKPLAALDSSRLLRIRESVASYRFDVEHVAGKENALADALSRAPANVASVGVADEFPDDSIDDPALSRLVRATAEDETLQLVAKAITSKSRPSELPPAHPARCYAQAYDGLSLHRTGLIVHGGRRIVVPRSLRRELIDVLHRGHTGITKTLALARQLYLWPGMANDLRQIIDACEACQSLRQGKPEEPPLVGRGPTAPMEQVSVDVATVNGVKWLVMVDRHSSLPFTRRINNDRADTVIRVLEQWFSAFGWPRRIGSDGGPCFRDKFEGWCEKMGIRWDLSSVAHPASNGLAEAGVKRVKHLLLKTGSEAAFNEAMEVFRRTPMSDGRPAPSTVFFGRVLRHPSLPRIDTARPNELVGEEEASKNNNNRFKPGDRVWIHNPTSKRWDAAGVIVEQRFGGRSYRVRKANGRITLRNRRRLRIDKTKGQC